MEKILKSPRGNLIYQHFYFPSSLFVYGCMLKKTPTISGENNQKGIYEDVFICISFISQLSKSL